MLLLDHDLDKEDYTDIYTLNIAHDEDDVSNLEQTN